MSTAGIAPATEAEIQAAMARVPAKPGRGRTFVVADLTRRSRHEPCDYLGHLAVGLGAMTPVRELDDWAYLVPRLGVPGNALFAVADANDWVRTRESYRETDLEERRPCAEAALIRVMRVQCGLKLHQTEPPKGGIFGWLGR